MAAMEPKFPPSEFPPSECAPLDGKTSKIDYQQPFESPYEGPTGTFVIGGQNFGLPNRIYRKIPRFHEAYLTSPTILSNIHEDAAHTFVHFLYTGRYQTIATPIPCETITSVITEYRKAVSVYLAARVYELADLESLATDYIERFNEDITIYDMLSITRDVFSSLPEDEDWLLGYIERSLQQKLMVEGPRSNLAEVYLALGQIHEFDLAVMKMVVRSFSAHLESIHDALDRTEELLQDSKKILVDCVDKGRSEASSEGMVGDSMEDHVEDSEPSAVDIEEPVEELVEEFNPAEVAIEEPVEAPAEELIEKGREQPFEFPVTDPAIGWHYLQKYRSRLEGIAWDSHPPTNEAADQDPSTPEPSLIENDIQPETIVINLSRFSEEDLALYDNWEGLSRKMRHRRKKKLTTRRLPIPSGDRAITLTVI